MTRRSRPDTQAILFDMDGVIVDSMPYHFIAWYEALRPYGVRINLFDVFAKEGERWEKSLKGFLRRAGLEPTEALKKEIFAKRQKIFRRHFKCWIFPGVGELIQCLKARGYKLGLVTGTPFKDVKRILPAAICGAFDVIVGGDSIRHGKPHPEPYLKAAALLKVKPAHCLVIENAPLGIASAKKAGMFCVGITTSLPQDYLRRADKVVESFTAISRLVNCYKRR